MTAIIKCTPLDKMTQICYSVAKHLPPPTIHIRHKATGSSLRLLCSVVGVAHSKGNFWGGFWRPEGTAVGRRVVITFFTVD